MCWSQYSIHAPSRRGFEMNIAGRLFFPNPWRTLIGFQYAEKINEIETRYTYSKNSSREIGRCWRTVGFFFFNWCNWYSTLSRARLEKCFKSETLNIFTSSKIQRIFLGRPSKHDRCTYQIMVEFFCSNEESI